MATYDGLFYRPTVLADVPAAAPAFAEEIFGPVAPVIRFSGVEERSGWPRTASTACRWASSPAT